MSDCLKVAGVGEYPSWFLTSSLGKMNGVFESPKGTRNNQQAFGTGIIIAHFVNTLVQWTPQWVGSESSAVITKHLYGHLLKESSVSVVAGANLFLV